MSQPRTPILYLHGLPGAAQADLAIAFGRDRVPEGITGLARLPAPTAGGTYEQAKLHAFDGFVEGLAVTKLRLVGFSLGALATLHIAAARPERISSVDLIAPAAPLQLGDFLGDMAGKPVFEAAKAGAWRLHLLTRIQSLGLRVAPGLIAGQLLGRAPEAEKALMSQAGRKAAFVLGMRYTIHQYTEACRMELSAYIADWSPVLKRVLTSVRIWQGTTDNWVPPTMARALASALGAQTDIEWIEGASHYGGLVHALPRIAEVP